MLSVDSNNAFDRICDGFDVELTVVEMTAAHGLLSFPWDFHNARFRAGSWNPRSNLVRHDSGSAGGGKPASTNARCG
jgi:hypothetical protein